MFRKLKSVVVFLKIIVSFVLTRPFETNRHFNARVNEHICFGTIFLYINHTTHNSTIRSDEGLTLETSASESLYDGQFILSTQLIKPNYLIKLNIAGKPLSIASLD